ncbi:MAG: alkylation response protein AidB-like acyl-CoA dehydrogenase [Verrucomicrobiales bacterium]|jgi:alkylation response protein AidB-like acyl-CoA dehydrogenase
MADYSAPIWDIRFILDELSGIEKIGTYPDFSDFDSEMVEPVLDEAARFVENTIAPLNRRSDEQGSSWNDDNSVTTPDGFVEAYELYVGAGWQSVSFDPAYGGGGFPWVMALALQEMLNSACMSFALCPLLTQGAIELLSEHGDEGQKETWLRPLVSGEWSATMNLTEPDAGSDVGAVRAKAERHADGSYRIRGQKIFITYGEHDMVDNIVHLVLARTADAPAGTKGISTFIVPKFLLDGDGKPTIRNDVACTSIEHKLGINGSPTCVLQFGENEGAIGYLIGEENRGMAYMFTMMNNARLSVGVQGLAIAERAYQDAVAYASERKQGRALDAAVGTSSPIIEHADVRRMLLTMKAYIEAMRGLVLIDGAAVDAERHHPDESARERAGERAALLTPITKGWCTDLGVELTSIALQVHGGMGFIEETGVAQHYRDARINPIYEGTNGIQALDLVARKLPLDGGRVLAELLDDIDATASAASRLDKTLADMGAALATANATVRATSLELIHRLGASPADAFAGATPYLSMLGQLVGGWSLLRQAIAAQVRLDAGEVHPKLDAKIVTAGFYCEQLLPLAAAQESAVLGSAEILMALTPEQF